MKGVAEIVMKHVEVDGMLKMLSYSACVCLFVSGMFTKTGLKTAFSFTYSI